MIKQVKKSKFKKTVAIYLAMMILLETLQPLQMYALTSGPTQPEFNAFTPIGASDMVDLASGDFNYNIPIMDVGGYPLNLAYNSGITMDQEASWAGLGWNLNVGQIGRQVRGLPDDFKGDEILYENDLRDNITVGTHYGLSGAFAGVHPPGITLGVGLGVEYNNYGGISFKPSHGIGFALSDNVSVGLNFSGSVADGASVSPSVKISKMMESHSANSCVDIEGTGTIGLSLNSRKGVENLNLSASVKNEKYTYSKDANGDPHSTYNGSSKGSMGGSISFNNQSYTPSKRIGYDNNSFTFNAAIGVEFFMAEGQQQITGYGSYQGISSEYKKRKEKAYGYENTEYKNKRTGGVLDFNREDERTVSVNTNALPVTNYTYDIYNIEGQGVSGMFRPYRSQVSYLYNDAVVDNGLGISVGAEFGIGNLAHGGVDFKISPSTSKTGGWFNHNNALPYFTERSTDARTIDYESTTFKLVGGMVVDPEQSIYEDEIHYAKALRIGLKGPNKAAYTTANYFEKGLNTPHAITSKIKRTKRYLRNQVIQKITDEEAKGDAFIDRNLNAKAHHTAGVKVLQTDGTSYVYGTSVYNTKKIEATFDVSDKTGNDSSGLVSYNGSTSGNNSPNSDKFLNKITTPQYAHSYLLSSVLSSDYEDIDGNGPSINDLGGYTQFIYNVTEPNYKWRIPFEKDMATYNGGLISHKDDEKGTYIYGEKELTYLNRIITKTHVAFFDLEDRKDACGVVGEHGGIGAGKMKKIKSIRLYSRKEVTSTNGEIVDPGVNGLIKPIKMAHFEYDYSLCPKISNNSGEAEWVNGANLNFSKGKLTLKKVYFTYRGSNMGKYTPYEFNYGVKYDAQGHPIENEDANPKYNNKGFDIWGNYKPNADNSGISTDASSPLSTTEFPFVVQNKADLVKNPGEDADKNTGVWNLKSIQLPSGGTLKIDTESDDYQHVQNKKAMQMFKVIGSGNSTTPSQNATLYEGNTHNGYIYVKLSKDELVNLNRQQFINEYLKENYNKAIQFRFLLNMTANSWQYDYVSGYFEIGETSDNQITINYSPSLGTVASIPLKFLTRDKGNIGTVNPIAKTGWGFGRTYLNRAVYSIGGDTSNTDFTSIVNDLVGSIGTISQIFTGPNKALETKGCARNFEPSKSWVRLENPSGEKLGGGLRVKSIKLSDNWKNMLSANGGTNLDNMEYGQEYSYKDDHGKSSGVATFEPNSSAENALVEPFYPKGGTYAEGIAAPAENNYVEKPFGENFFPAPRVTYSSVTVKNLEKRDGEKIVKKHATGKVVTKHYTTFDFPTKVEYTDLDVKNGLTPNTVLSALIKLANLRIRDHLTMSQGFSIETNDMNGKMKSQEVYPEGQNIAISSVVYKYNLDDKGDLDSNLPTINSKGEVEKRLIGLDYDMINDFNESSSTNEVVGFDGNLAAFLLAIFPAFVPTILPKVSYNENQLRTAVTTKVVHKTGILKEKIAYDLGSTVSTKNLAWDASSGAVLLTETINEYNDHYFSFNYPAYWMHEGMGLASQNIGIEGVLKAYKPTIPIDASDALSTDPHFYIKSLGAGVNISQYFHVGDEIYTGTGASGGGDVSDVERVSTATIGTKLWVVGFNKTKTGVLLMDRNGNYINKCEDFDEILFKIVRSGYRNLQSAFMASVTSMTNPIDIDGNGVTNNITKDSFEFTGSSNFNPRVINASAVVYKDFWRPQDEANLPYYPEHNSALVTTNSIGGNIGTTDLNYIDATGNVKYPHAISVNPYVWNIKGDWKAEKSYAYLAGRNASSGQINNPRNEGFYTKFNPFYKLVTGFWTIDETNWTYASSVTQHSPYGAELENKDALNRYSSAQYGYNYTLPMAVASNSKYQQIGYEGFEEKTFDVTKKHFGFQVNQSAISSQQSHTGKNSIKVNRGQSTSLSRVLSPSSKTIYPEKCPKITVGDGNGENFCSGISGGGNTIIFGSNVSIQNQCGNVTVGHATAAGNTITIHPNSVWGPTGTFYITALVGADINGIGGQIIYITIGMGYSSQGLTTKSKSCDYTINPCL